MTQIIIIVILALLAAVFVVTTIIMSGKASTAREKAESSALEAAALRGRLQTQEALAEEREKAFDVQRKQMEESFKLLSEQNSAGLRRQNAESLAELLKPIQEKFSGFEKSVRESQEKSVAQDSAMRELLNTVMKQSESIGSEARNLANALTGHAKIQGNFGEMLLVDLLKQSGLQEGVHFTTQDVLRDAQGHEIKSESGATMIPDVIVYYPDGSEVIIDSKVSLNAYVEYMNCEDPVQRPVLAKRHVDSISRHIDELKLKDYASYIEEGKRKVDYNIMFIPMEGAFRAMLDEAPTLWQKAKDSKVLIVSQQNLMIVLNMILMSWRQYDRERNIEEVYSTASELMSQLKNWMDSFVKVGDYLDKARISYEDSRKKLVESNQSVIRKIDKLEHLKLSPKRSNARIKSGARIVNGQESIIPAELSSDSR
ncbi:MAG: DNA recombination protein RmuC [Bacteroidales bacterium]|nr:DNA recombination protein RmuC [Bacteroidales bacterium]